MTGRDAVHTMRAALRVALLAGLAIAAAPAAAQAGSAAAQAAPCDVASAPDPAQLRTTVTALVGFGTRHTLSDTATPGHGIGAARHWVRQRFEALSAGCGGCLEVVTPAQRVSGERMPAPVDVVDVVAIQKGSADADRVIVLTGHLDSRAGDAMDAASDAPGADDDASGVAAVIEAARVLSGRRFAATIVYGALSGEEQGLYGGRILAEYAKSRGWRVEADLNNDIVGASRGENGVADNTRVRLFSEGTRAAETAGEARQRRYEGGENDSPSRNVARYVKALAERCMPNWTVATVYRLDRYGRGGDHAPFNELGFAAVRFTENAEDYRHQHQNVRTEGGVPYGDTIDHLDFDYLARVTATNAVAAAAMASAPPPPVGVAVAGAVSPDTRVSWKPSAGAGGHDTYRVYGRETPASAWANSRDAGAAESLVLPGIAVDDYAFGVASVSPDGYESPVVFAGAAGAFWQP